LSEREIFTRAMTTPHTPARVDFMAQFGVEWLDPTADRKLLERLLTFPLHIFRVGNRPRGLARELGRGRLPDVVRLRRARSTHFPGQTAWFTARADDYRKAFRKVARFLQLRGFSRLAQSRAAVGNSVRGRRHAGAGHNCAPALDAGLFAAARESGRGLESAQHAGNAPVAPGRPTIPTLKVFGSDEVDSTQRARA